MGALARRGLKRRLIRAAIVLAAACGLLAAAAYLWPLPAIALGRRAVLALAGAEHGTAEFHGEAIAWVALGQGDPLLLLHGLRGESVVMLPLARRLAARGHRVVMVDLPGHGSSPDPRAPLTLTSAGETVLGVAHALALSGPVPCVGHSMGGWILGWQALAHPERCSALVLVSTAGARLDPPNFNWLLPSRVADARQSLRLLFADPPWIPTPLLWLSTQRSSRAPVDLLRSVLGGNHGLEPLLPGLAVPALVVHGAEDRLIPPDAARRLAAAIPSRPSGAPTPFVIIPKAGHMVIVEQPEELAQVIDEFLRRTADERLAPAPGPG